MSRSRRALAAFALGAGAWWAARASARFGLTRSQAEISLPGDLILPGARVVADRAILIRATPRAVWPWLTQMGQDRGGFYSFTGAENALGCRIDDVRELRAQWASRPVGDQVFLAPGTALRVAVAEPGRALVLTSEGGRLARAGRGSTPFDFTWAFVLLPEGGGTRLHVRERYRPHSRRARLICRATLPVSALMSARMLCTIRGLAEAGTD